MLGPPKARDLSRPVVASLEALVPGDHFYRQLDATLDLGFVREWARDCYAASGRPSIDPVVFFQLQLIMFFEGLRSERRLMETVALNLAHRWYLGYHLDEPLPDHSSLTRIRQRLGLPIFQRFFEHIVELCLQAGLVWGQELFFDGTKVQANAAIDSLQSRWSAAARAYLADLFAGQATGAPPWDLPGAREEAPAAAPVAATGAAPAAGPLAEATRAEPGATVPDGDLDRDPAAPRRLPFAGTPEQERRLTEANQAAWQLLEERRRDPDEPSGSRGYRRTSDEKVSTTDPDATPMRRFTGDLPKLGYHDHYVVDGGKARIILAALVTPADVMDNTPMLDLFHRVRFRWRLGPERAVGDGKYGTIANIRGLEDAGVRAFLPLPELGRRHGFYGPERFRYDAGQDEYRCPQGHPLTFERVKWTEDVAVYRADPGICRGCPVRRECTDSRDGRLIHRSLFADYIERVRGYHETEAYRRAMRKRKVWPEPLFGEAKQWHGLRRFRLRGLANVNMEGLLIAAGQNLKRWLSATGPRRRHSPAGSPCVSSATRRPHPSAI